MQINVSIPVSGGIGNATTEMVRGFVESVIVSESGGTPGATVTITEVDSNGRVIATYTGNGGETHPAAKLVDNTGTAISNSFRPFWIPGYPLYVAVSAATTAKVTVRIDVSPDSAFVS